MVRSRWARWTSSPATRSLSSAVVRRHDPVVSQIVACSMGRSASHSARSASAASGRLGIGSVDVIRAAGAFSVTVADGAGMRRSKPSNPARKPVRLAPGCRRRRRRGYGAAWRRHPDGWRRWRRSRWRHVVAVVVAAVGRTAGPPAGDLDAEARRSVRSPAICWHQRPHQRGSWRRGTPPVAARACSASATAWSWYGPQWIDLRSDEPLRRKRVTVNSASPAVLTRRPACVEWRFGTGAQHSNILPRLRLRLVARLAGAYRGWAGQVQVTIQDEELVVTGTVSGNALPSEVVELLARFRPRGFRDRQRHHRHRGPAAPDRHHRRRRRHRPRIWTPSPTVPRRVGAT